MDSREHDDDDRDLGSDLQLAGDAYKLLTAHAPTMDRNLSMVLY